jgi:hypothetical protein
LLPVRGAFWAIGQVADAADRQVYGPAMIRRRLMELARKLDAGTISAEEFDRLEDELLDRLAMGTELQP